MRIVFTTGFYDATVSADIILTRRSAFQRFAEALQKLGHETLVVHPFKEDAERVKNGVHHQFVRASWWARWGSVGRTHYELTTRTLPILANFQPDMIHFSGLTLDLNLWLVTHWGKRHHVPVIVQYHGGQPARNRLRRWIQRGNVRRATRLLFTAKEQAMGWDAADKVVEFTEMSSDFRPKSNARLTGSPALLCVSQLSPRKDPLTILRAMRFILREQPNAHLYWAYHKADLLTDVETFIVDNQLTDHVTLLGNVPHSTIEQLYNGADFFIQASLSDVASIAVLEAMACGVTPILSNIPAFRRLTKGGSVGRLFTVGHAEELAAAVLAGKNGDVHTHFLTKHSYPALARQLTDIYCSSSIGGDLGHKQGCDD